jgi:hypothetical protein
MDVRFLSVFTECISPASLHRSHLLESGNQPKIWFHLNEVVLFNTLFSGLGSP